MIPSSKEYSETVTPYLARIDAKTMEVDVLPLQGGTSVNYVGGVLVHANGFLYAVARSVLFKVDAASFTIVKSTPLPLLPDSKGQDNDATAYNGLVATANGDLVLKGWASTGGGDAAPGYLLRVEPENLQTLATMQTDVITSARMTIVSSEAGELIYMPGKTQSLRFRVEPNAFVLDDGFSRSYLSSDSGATQASSDVYLGSGVVFADNTVPSASTPMQLFAQASAAGGSDLSATQAFESADASWNFFMVAGDPYRSGIVAVGDQVSGHVAGYVACAGGGTVQKAWENDSLQASAGVAIDYEHGVLYTDDRECVPRDGCRLSLVALDLHTGQELARVGVAGTKPSIGQIFIGPDDAVYYPATDIKEANGYVTRVVATPQHAENEENR
jgi:hypothetical protein